MIEPMGRALTACQAALFARGLYNPNHPAVQTALDRAESALKEALAGATAGITAMRVDDRVVCEGKALSVGRGLDGLFLRLAGLGIEWVRFEPGAGKADLSDLVERIERGERTPDAWAMRAIHVGFIQGLKDRPAASAGLIDPALSSPDRAALLERLWRDLRSHGRLDSEVLGGVVAEICAASAPTGGALLRLAALKSHDEYTFVHTVNVAILSAALAHAAGLPSNVVHDVTVAALLHDVGKSLVPREVLNKDGALSDEERAIVRKHPLDGAVILLNARDLNPITAVVAFEHHVRMDGGGYPRVPKGWRTSVYTRIVQVADVFDALRTIRPYRAAMSLPEVVAELRRNAGTAHDPELLEIFLSRVAARTDREREEVRAVHRAAA